MCADLHLEFEILLYIFSNLYSLLNLAFINRNPISLELTITNILISFCFKEKSWFSNKDFFALVFYNHLWLNLFYICFTSQ